MQQHVISERVTSDKPEALPPPTWLRHHGPWSACAHWCAAVASWRARLAMASNHLLTLE